MKAAANKTPKRPEARGAGPAFTQISIAFQHDDPDVWLCALRADGTIWWKRRDDTTWTPDAAPLPP